MASSRPIQMLLVGKAETGKTSLLKQLEGKQNFRKDYRITIGVDLYKLAIDNTQVNIIDTAGNEQYSNISKAFYKNKDIYIIVLSNEDEQALVHLQQHLAKIKECANETATTLVVVNKCDLHGISTDEAQKRALDAYCESQDLPIHYITATKHDEVESFFKAAVLQHLRKQVPEIEFIPLEQKTQPQSPPQKKEFFEDYLKWSWCKFSLFCIGTHHIDRARAVKAALMKCDNNDNKLKIIENQIAVLNRRDRNTEDAKALGLDARWAERSRVKNSPHYLKIKNSGYYRELLRIREELKSIDKPKELYFFEQEGAGPFYNSQRNRQ